MMKKHLVFCAFLMVGLGGGQPLADDSGLPGAWLGRSNSLYFGAGFQFRVEDGYEWQTLPRRDRPNGVPAPGAVLTFDTGNALKGFSAHLGYVFRDGTFPAWLGRNFRVEVSGGWAKGTSSRTRDEAPTRAFAVLPLDGSFVLANNAFPVRYAGRQDVKARRGSFRLKLASDIRIARRWIVTPSASFNYRLRSKKIDTDYVADQILFPGFVFPVTLRERLRSSTFGGRLGLQVTFQPIPEIALFAGGTLGASHIRASYRGQDCFSIVPVPAPCNNFIATSVSSRKRRLSLAGGVSGGVSFFLLKKVIVTMVGHADFDRNGLAVRYPTETDRRPASLEFRHRWTYGARVTVTVPLGFSAD